MIWKRMKKKICFFNKLSKALFLDLCVGSDLAFLSCDTNSELILLLLNGIASFLYWCKTEEKFLRSFPKEVVWFSSSRSYQCLHLGKPLRAVSCRLYSCFFFFSAVCVLLIFTVLGKQAVISYLWRTGNVRMK